MKKLKELLFIYYLSHYSAYFYKAVFRHMKGSCFKYLFVVSAILSFTEGVNLYTYFSNIKIVDNYSYEHKPKSKTEYANYMINYIADNIQCMKLENGKLEMNLEEKLTLTDQFTGIKLVVFDPNSEYRLGLGEDPVILVTPNKIVTSIPNGENISYKFSKLQSSTPITIDRDFIAGTIENFKANFLTNMIILVVILGILVIFVSKLLFVITLSFITSLFYGKRRKMDSKALNRIAVMAQFPASTAEIIYRFTSLQYLALFAAKIPVLVAIAYFIYGLKVSRED